MTLTLPQAQLLELLNTMKKRTVYVENYEVKALASLTKDTESNQAKEKRSDLHSQVSEPPDASLVPFKHLRRTKPTLVKSTCVYLR